MKKSGWLAGGGAEVSREWGLQTSDYIFCLQQKQMRGIHSV